MNYSELKIEGFGCKLYCFALMNYFLLGRLVANYRRYFPYQVPVSPETTNCNGVQAQCYDQVCCFHASPHGYVGRMLQS